MCGNVLPKNSLLHFHDMPKAAQFLPDADNLAADAGVDLLIYQCASCGLVQSSNEPVAYYKEVVRAAAFSEEMQTFRQVQFAQFVQDYALKGKKLIEIGCGRGEYLQLLQSAGVEAYGMEYGADSVRQCVAAGLDVTPGYIDSAEYVLEHAPFDAFAVLNFMEHWPDPGASLRGIANNLVEDGIGLVEVPNLDMILKNNLFTEFISDHILYFTRESLVTMLQLNGFEVLSCDEVWHGYILSAVVRKRKSCDVSAFASRRLNIKSEVDCFIQQHATEGVAIWGAGHQALAAIALLGLAKEIKYVVDSAPFKQGKFTPASHIAIVAPAYLKEHPVGAVMVMAASYSDEVAHLIRRDWPAVTHVAILRDAGLEYV
jgi:SAM-dependent methyltransferase